MKQLTKGVLTPLWAFALLTLSHASSANSEEPLSFATPDEAVQALLKALEKNDTTQLELLLGPNSEDLVYSGDEVFDANNRTLFVDRFNAKHQLVENEDKSLTLVVGEDDWPLPIPIVAENGKWSLDAAAGAEEILYRRIGHNELGAIAVCRGFIDGQREYAATGHDGLPAGLFAAKIRSDKGQQNGLYWPVTKDEPVSPAGLAIARAAAEGYKAVAGKRTPYHGYYYRILYAQGEFAEGGAKEYFVDGKLSEGVALIAWPATYGASGIMSFIVNHQGLVYQKDLGEQTEAVVESIQLFNPDKSWSQVMSSQ